MPHARGGKLDGTAWVICIDLGHMVSIRLRLGTGTLGKKHLIPDPEYYTWEHLVEVCFDIFASASGTNRIKPTDIWDALACLPRLGLILLHTRVTLLLPLPLPLPAAVCVRACVRAYIYIYIWRGRCHICQRPHKMDPFLYILMYTMTNYTIKPSIF